MLNPLTALGLAGNLIQVIQFSYDIVSEGNKIYNDASGIVTQNKATEEVASDLAKLTEALKAKQDEWRVAHGRTALEPDEILLRNLCDKCVEVAFELQIQLDKLKAKEGSGKRLRSYKAALVSVWRKDQVEEIAQRLERYQREVDTRVIIGIRHSLQEADARNTQQFDTLDQRTKDLTDAVLSHNGSFHTKLDQNADTLAQIAAGQAKTHELLQVVVKASRTPSPGPPTYDQSITDAGSVATALAPSPLHQASAGGHTTKLRQLLRDPSVDVHAHDEHGCTPLHLAQNAEAAKYLLRDKRVDHGHEDDSGRSALHYAVLKRRLDVVKVLLDSGVDAEWQDDVGKTAKFYAQDCPATLFMLRYGTEVEARAANHLNNTGLLHLAWLGDKEGTQFYIDQGADVNARNSLGETALTEAARHGDVEIAEMLLKHGADTEIAASNEWTALLQAIRDGREAVVPILLKYGAKKRATLASGNSTLPEACWRAHFGIARLLIEAGSSVNTRDLRKATPLFKASFEGDIEFVRWALQVGADANAANDAGLTPLYVACERGRTEITTLLLEAGASHRMREPKYNWTPLSIAARGGRNKVVKVLLQYGADPNAKGHNQHTAAAIACHHGHPKMLKHFIAAGTDIEATINTGFTPLGVAAHTGQDECVRVLVDAGAKLEATGYGHKRPEYATSLFEFDYSSSTC